MDKDTTLDIHELAEQFHQVRQKRLHLNREVAALEQQEATLKYQLTREMKARGLTSFKTTGHTVVYEEVKEPYAADWSKVIQYVKETGSVDLFQKRLTLSAVRLRLEAGERIPGIEMTDKPILTME